MDDEQKPINYEFLQKLVKIDGLSNVLQKRSSSDAHAEVIANYRRVLVDDRRPGHLPPVHAERRLGERTSLRLSEPRDDDAGRGRVARSCADPPATAALLAADFPEHDIRRFTRMEHAANKAALPKPSRRARLQALRQLLKKPQYERSSDDNAQLYRLMRHFDGLRSQMGDSLLRQVAGIAKLERWPEGDVTLLGHGSLFVVLRGCAVAVCEPCVRDVDESQEEFAAKCRTVPEGERRLLQPGDTFGTLNYTEQPSDGSDKILAFHLPENNTEFLKISSYDFGRIREQTEARDEVEKTNLLKSNPRYALWSAQPLLKVARIIDWLLVPANTVVASEGFSAPFIGFVKSGSCLLLRQLLANKTLANGKQVQRTAQIVMARLGPRQSFGEASVLDGEDMACTLVAEDDVIMAVLRPERLAELDADTRLLIGQSADENLGKMPQEEVEKEYVIQESAKEWNETKQTVVHDVINTRGIRPGFGKWAK